MSSSPLPANSSRLGGCTLTGALSVTSQVRDAVTVVHGPRGCSHHNLSLLHATCCENGRGALPEIVSSDLSETEIVFGGEDALRKAIGRAAERDIRAVFVLSTCVVGTIGDDTEGICREEFGVPVIPLPTAGFLGGSFQDGVNKALVALAVAAGPSPARTDVSIVGEMNLEYEVEENYAEIARLLSCLRLSVGIRFVHDTAFDRLPLVGAARLNILRDPALVPVGEYLQKRFGTPYLPAFPRGLAGTLSFLRSAAAACGTDGEEAVIREEALQREMMAAFADLRGRRAACAAGLPGGMGGGAAEEAARMLGMTIGNGGGGGRLPPDEAVGTAGTRRMLHRWRRAFRGRV